MANKREKQKPLKSIFHSYQRFGEGAIKKGETSSKLPEDRFYLGPLQ